MDGPCGGAESAKRRQILEGARRVFLASGFDGASMGEIAKAAGVSKGTLYVYFDSKEKLFEALTIEEKEMSRRNRFPRRPGRSGRPLCADGPRAKLSQGPRPARTYLVDQDGDRRCREISPDRADLLRSRPSAWDHEAQGVSRPAGRARAAIDRRHAARGSAISRPLPIGHLAPSPVRGRSPPTPDEISHRSRRP